jgi:hypothetical protein
MNQSDYKTFEVGSTIQMNCFSCRAVTTFTVFDQTEGPVCKCGHYKDSEAQGAKELCEMATWHDKSEYLRHAKIARAGGLEVSDTPRYLLQM